MQYPFLLYRKEIRHLPIFTGLTGDPLIFDLSFKNRWLEGIDVRDPHIIQNAIADRMQPGQNWGISGYLERRDSLLRDCPQMVTEERFFHLGVDIIVDKGTDLNAPLDARVAEAGYEAGEGNYGGFVLLEHAGAGFETFYSFYGHLCRSKLPAVRTRVGAGDAFAVIGDFHENGSWFTHTHLQVITAEGLRRGYMSKGYCAEADLGEINDLCPSPYPLFRR